MKSPLLAIGCLLVTNLAATLAAPPQAIPQAPAAVDVDFEASRIVRGGVGEALDPAILRSVLGVGDAPENPKGSAAAAIKEGEEVEYLVVFKKPALIGTILGGNGKLRIYKSGAPLPVNLTNASNWIDVEVANQSVPRFAPLPPKTSTSAIRMGITLSRRSSPYLRFLAPRLSNHTPTATANAQSEFTTEPYLSAPYTYDAGHVTRGRGEWISSGKNGKGINSRAPITDVAPAWFILSWPEKRNVDGVLLQDNFSQFDLQVFIGPAGINPVAATEQEWKTLSKPQQVVIGGQRWLSFAQEQTRALRLHIKKTADGAVAKVSGFHVFADLGDKPAPAVVAPEQQESPVKIPYELAQDGKVTLVVDGPDGGRVRNLVANISQIAGPNSVAWDLKDEEGKMVPPGKYRWKAITHPPLELRYEMTPYPNVKNHAPDNAPWMTGSSGPGGWMADHSAPHSACSSGDRVFLGSPVSESGVSLIECNLDGQKLWAHPSFAAWTGSWMLASDGKTVFNTMAASNFAKAGLDKGTDGIWAVDLETRKVRTVAMLQPTAERKRGLQGFAARDNKVYLAVHAMDNWLNNAFSSGDVDSQNCLPAYATPRPSRGNGHEVIADPRSDFLRLLRIKDAPPGQGLGLTWMESTKSADRQQHIVVAFTKPVALGSLVFPPPPKEEKVQFQISVLKPGAPYPPRPNEKSDWEVIPSNDRSAWAVLPLPAGTLTRALRLTFLRGGQGAADDLLADIEEPSAGPAIDPLATGGAKKSNFETDANAWQRRLEGMKLLGRRFENVFGGATVRVSSGKVGADGSWDAQRSEPLSEADPAVYAMEWKQAQTVRGLAIKEIDGERTEIDIYTGAAGGAVDIKAAEGWENVASYQQSLRNYYQPDVNNNNQARYVDGYVDFGREVSTRAIRLRVVKQWDTKGHHPSGVRNDQGGQLLDLKRCHVYGVAALKYLGGEKAQDPMVTDRLEVVDAASGKIVNEVPLANAGATGGGAARGNMLAFNPKGELFAIAGEKLVHVDLTGGQYQVLVSDLLKPTALACDPAGNFVIFDGAPERQNIRVYDAAGKFVRVIGTPGGYQRGAWDVNRLQNVRALAVDGRGQIWAVETNNFPKRVSLWNIEGKFLKEFLGNTEYGGGGYLDPGDRERLFYGPMEFALDWKTGLTRLKNLTALNGGDTSDVPMRVNNRLYLVNGRPTPSSNVPQCGRIYLHEGDRARLVAAVGIAGEFKQMLDPKLVKAFGGKVLLDYQCAWSDLNGDEQVQPDEVQLWPKPKNNPAVIFDRELNAQIGQVGFKVKKWLPSGVPVYERVEMPGLWNGNTLRLDNGNYYHFENTEHEAKIAVLTPEGKALWTYKTEGAGVHALTRSKPIYPGQIVCQFGFAGHTTAHAGDLGEFMVINTNVGLFNIMTADGLFAGQIFRDIRDRQSKPWSSPESARGLRLDEMTLGQEHFNGYFCRTTDNQYYVVAGHNHASVVEVVGMDRFKRFGGEITIGAPELAAVDSWERARALKQIYARAPVVDCFKMTVPPKLDGQLNDWPVVSSELDDIARFRIGYDDSNLYLAYEVDHSGPFKNQGKKWDGLFKTGACVDLQIATDPAAPADRKAPTAGDQRLLMTFMGDEPTAVLYQAVVPGTPAAKVWNAVSPVGSVSFDRVAQLEKPRIFAVGDNDHYVVEASIPLAALGLKITPNLRVKMDWGILASGPDGNEVLRREYWANKMTAITSDVPSEAQLHPDLWGHIRFHAEAAGSALDPAAGKQDKGLEDVLNDLK